MKNRGLRNRFSEETRLTWLYWYDCMICGRNKIDALHHIVSPSSRLYVDGEHNESVFNSCPIHNFVCHIGNEAFLYDDSTIKMLLNKVALALLDDLEYVPDERDIGFVRHYKMLYNKDVLRRLAI